MEKLKPCPFCGGNPEIYAAFGAHVKCECCDAKIYRLSSDEAIKAWNTRV